MYRLEGISASHGITIGKVFVLERGIKIKVNRYDLPLDEVQKEIEHFKSALAKTKEEILSIKDHVSVQLNDKYANIFEAHLFVLEDPFLILEVTQMIEKEKVNAGYALWKILERLMTHLSSINDEYIRERAVDIYDVGRRILQNLAVIERLELNEIKEDVVIVAHNLTPSDMAHMFKQKVRGFATDIGGRTSHVAIMAEALGIPAVVGLKNVTRFAKTGDTIVIDGSHGVVIINPSEDVIAEYQRKRAQIEAFKAGLAWLKDLPAQTKDGFRIRLMANIELPDEEIPVALQHGAEGIGLYRTEFLYLNRVDLPSEDEQYEAYRKVISSISPHPVTIRTIDLGGDKFLSHLGMPTEISPFLGFRAIRLCLKHPEIFKTQLKAILRASTEGKVRIMFPMISCMEELIAAKAIFFSVCRELEERNVPFDKHIKVGVMIETPSAALIPGILAEESDFFSIGTNDLIQYTLAVDRASEEVAYLFDPMHIGILRLIKHIIDEAHRTGQPVGMCGEMATDPLLAVVLLGFGLDEFSVSSHFIPKIKKLIREITLREAIEIANEVMKLQTSSEVKALLEGRLRDRFWELLEA